MRIGLSYDLKTAVPAKAEAADDSLEEYDSPETVALISSSLEAGSHTVVRLGGGVEFLRNILCQPVDFVFNIAEGRGSYRSREAQVPAVLEMLDIPYSGSDPQSLAVCLDKSLTQKLVAAAGVRTPGSLLISDKQGLAGLRDFSYPAIVKPAYEGSSKGIRQSSVVDGPEQAARRVGEALAHYGQPVILEEFITGDEITMGIIGNSPPRVLGMMRILPRRREGHFVYSIEVKRNYLELVDYECPARLEPAVLSALEASGLGAFAALGCRDFARLDFRLGPDGVPYFLEINPLPGLGTHSDLVIMAKMLGWAHQQLVAAVLGAAVERYPQCVRA